MADERTPSVGRIVVVSVGPSLEEGRWSAKAVVGEAVPIVATVFQEGHGAVGATAIVTHPDGSTTSLPMVCINPGLTLYRAAFVPRELGAHAFKVEGWADPVATWQHAATVKLHAGQDVSLVLAEGAAVLGRALAEVQRSPEAHRALEASIDVLAGTALDPEERLASALSPEVKSTLAESPLRDFVTSSREYPLRVERERALVGAWYEMFVRSEGARLDAATGRWTSGSFATAAKRLPAIAAMGFDVLYLTPIHPIGTTLRKGRNNATSAEDGDPGSPYAIGSAEGGHDAVHPDLGTMDQFREFVAKARDLGLEVALDLALQCSPDHPWVRDHPEWFATRADGSIAYAENPPKKYQDIFPLSFDRDAAGLYHEIRRIVQVWIDAGVTVFRVDNPHTKPLPFWERFLADVAHTHPDVIFLSEAFTRPPMMHTLAKIGFHQSYTYFTWRPTAAELGEYLAEVSGDAAAYMRPNFWPTTHDILTPDMQAGGAPLFAARAVIAATGSPSWGIYSGYELVENVARPGVEEQIDNEKYEYKPRQWAKGKALTSLIATLNGTRRAHPALQRLRGLTLHYSDDPDVLVYSRHVDAAESPTGKPDSVFVVASLDPFREIDAEIYLDFAAVGLDLSTEVAVTDALTGRSLTWAPTSTVKLGPKVGMAIVGAVSRG